MRDAKLSVWFAPEDMKGGRKTLDQIDEAIRIESSQCGLDPRTDTSLRLSYWAANVACVLPRMSTHRTKADQPVAGGLALCSMRRGLGSDPPSGFQPQPEWSGLRVCMQLVRVPHTPSIQPLNWIVIGDLAQQSLTLFIFDPPNYAASVVVVRPRRGLSQPVSRRKLRTSMPGWAGCGRVPAGCGPERGRRACPRGLLQVGLLSRRLWYAVEVPAIEEGSWPRNHDLKEASHNRPRQASHPFANRHATKVLSDFRLAQREIGARMYF